MLMSACRVLVRLLREFVSGQVISFAMGGGCGGMSVGSKVMQFSSSIVRTLGHRVLLANLDAAMERPVTADLLHHR